jgi:predicted adenine nucleotide alpha hydrolase (AANH) superfamily ATPase
MILVHICCAVDSHFFLQRLQKEYPSKKLVGFFYDPNIHPYSEYLLRLLDVKRSCDMLGIELIEGDYDYEAWIESVRGYEDEPEQGKRCKLCFDNRLNISAKKAVELGCKSVTTTLMMSPKKSIQQLQLAGELIEKNHDIEFLIVDFKKAGGTNKQFALAKKDRLYHQDYCGCIYALTKQRESQKRVADELFSPLSAQILPESIEEKIELYKKRMDLESKNIPYKIVRENFLNYRLFQAHLKVDKKIIPSHILPFSTIKRKFIKFKIEDNIQDIYFSNRENIRLISLFYYNKLSKQNYKNIKELIYNPPSFESELELKNQIVNTPYSLSTVLVIEDIEQMGRYELLLESKTYEDVKEILVNLG